MDRSQGVYAFIHDPRGMEMKAKELRGRLPRTESPRQRERRVLEWVMDTEPETEP